MNVTLTMVKKNVVIKDGTLQIYYGGFIETQKIYDMIVHSVLGYLIQEGFLDDFYDGLHPQVFDYKGKQVFRGKCV
jgi:hypothetical protein